MSAGDNHFDPVQFGQMLEAMKSLKAELAANTAEQQKMRHRLDELEDQYRFGKGAVFGICIAAGFAVKGFWTTISGMFG